MNITHWDGASWLGLGSGIGFHKFGISVDALGLHDDGSGISLVTVVHEDQLLATGSTTIVERSEALLALDL